MDPQQFLDKLIEAWNSHDRDRLLALYHPEFEGEDLPEGKMADGLRDAARMIDYILNAFPDIQMTQLDSGFNDKGQVFFFWEATGHHRGRLMNIPPTGKPVHFVGSTVFALRDGLIVRSRRLWDAAAILRQIGLLPELPRTHYA